MNAVNVGSILKNDRESLANDKLASDVNIIDSEWVSTRFMIPNSKVPESIRKYRFASTSMSKFTDTSLGGNLQINPRPQFTRYCDIRSNGQYTTRTRTSIGTMNKSKLTNGGMGRYYSESIDDNQQLVFIEFGLPKFNSLTDFFLRAIDYADSVVANTGRTPTFYHAGQIVGAIAMAVAFPLVSIMVYSAKLLAKVFSNVSMFNYYYMQPKMHMYWATVNQLVSQLSTELGILIPELMEGNASDLKNKHKTIGVPTGINSEELKMYSKLFPPGFISENNYIDVFAIATRAQRVANEQRVLQLELMESESTKNIQLSTTPNAPNGAISKAITKIDNALTFSKYLETINPAVSKLGKGDPEQKEPVKLTDQEKAAKEEEAKKNIEKAKTDKASQFQRDPKGTYTVPENENEVKENDTWFENFIKTADSTVRQGGAYACFAVDFTGSVSESFSNSTGSISTGDKIKELAKTSRNLKFDLAGGNVADGVGSVLTGIKDIAAGVLDSVSFGLSSVIQTMTGGAFIDIPKKWEDSSMSFPSISYSMQLISPYGNVMSQLQNMYIPLCMILAGVLPLATGRSSYTSPYLCNVFSKGVQSIRLGMITDVSITRGTSNLAFSKERRPLAIDVTFQITDFSNLIAAPVNAGAVSAVKSAFLFATEDDTNLGNYLATLGSRDLLTMKYASKKAKLKLSKAMMDIDQSFSAASWGMRFGNTIESVIGPLASVQSVTGNHLNSSNR